MITLGALSFALAASALGATKDLSIPHEKYVLEQNGLEVILSEDHTLPIAAVNVWYHVGPLNEPEKRTGFAHLFEHLMFQGSGHVGDDQHFKLLESSGASLINGTTDYDRTNYFETVPANELEMALWLESDRMGFLLDSLTQDKLDNQRQVVMNERRQSLENAPYGPSAEKLVQTLLPPDHPYYGYVMGSMADLGAATLEDVRAFYTRYYAPANATLVVAGDFDTARVKGLITRYFGSLARRDAPPARAVLTPTVTAERRATVKEPVALPRVSMAWLSPAAYKPGDADADVLAMVLGGGKSSRLYHKLVYELELAQNVSVNQESLALVSMFSVSVTGKPGVDPAKLEAEVGKLLEEARAKAPTPREVERARNQLQSRMVSQLQSLGGFGGKADMLNRYNQYVKDPGFFSQDMARYDAVTPESVLNIAKSILNPTARAVVTTVPEP
jgi:zinc protease